MAAPNAQPALKLDPRTYARARACVHCGLCLPACPTYAQNGLEVDSPRGRLYLMKALADGRIELTRSVQHHLDLCLDCRACETACPSGVVYHEVIEETRQELARRHKLKGTGAVMQWLFLHLFTRPVRLKWALLGPRLLQAVRLWGAATVVTAKLLPPKFNKMQQMLPPRGPVWESTLAKRYPAHGTPRHRVGFFHGCISSVLEQDINRKAIELLQLCGCEVIVPRAQRCCGAIHHHAGRPHPAAAMARRNIAAFEDVDEVITAIGGCGAMLKQYEHLLRDDERWLARARAFTAKVRDINQALHDYNLKPPRFELRAIAAYHDSCHLAHGQHITAAPRELLRSIPGLVLRRLPEADMCCGAAGTYNLQQPRMSRDLAARKLRHIQATGASICVTANIGCAMQIQSEARQLGIDLQIRHPVELLHEAYFGPPV